MPPMVRTLRVSEKGQVVLPADVRRAMGIERGTELVLVFDGERILLQREDSAAKAMEEDFADLLAATGQTLQPVWENEDDAAWDRV